MSETPRSSSRLVLSAVLILCAGAGAWFYTKDSAVQKTASVQNTAVQALPVSETVSGGAQPAEASSVNAETEDVSKKGIKAESSSHQVSAALNSGPRPRVLTPEEKLQAKVESAIASAGEALPGGDSTGGSLSQEAAKPSEDRQDPVVTRHFVSDLAGWLVHRYEPSRREGSEGRSSATLRAANARYSVSPSLRSIESDALKGRAFILRYVYSPGMLEALYRMYAPEFIDELVDVAQKGNSPLTREQTAGMLKVYAEKLVRIGAALEAASRVDIKALVRPVRQAVAREEAASEAFARAYSAHAEARETGRREAMTKQSELMVRSARAASQADSREEQARRNVARVLRERTEGPALPDAELIFLAEWLDRRDASREATSASANICRRMAADLKSRAAELFVPAE
ncbi:hypothetical protein [Mailhella sp.]